MLVRKVQKFFLYSRRSHNSEAVYSFLRALLPPFLQRNCTTGGGDSGRPATSTQGSTGEQNNTFSYEQGEAVPGRVGVRAYYYYVDHHGRDMVLAVSKPSLCGCRVGTVVLTADGNFR